jgi:hypothetical protein
MKTLGLLLVAALALAGFSTPAATSAATAAGRHLVYQFGYNAKAAPSGPGTGTTTIAIGAAAPDGGVMISGTDNWWNSARPRATNTCEVYSDGKVACATRPYSISPIQLSIFPLLAKSYFKGLNAAGTSTWNNAYTVDATVLPGSGSTHSTPTTWKIAATLQGKGPIPNGPLMLIESTVTMDQQGGHYRQGTGQVSIAYDPVANIPVIVDDIHTHLPQTTTYNKDYVSLRLLSDSAK